MLIHVCIHIVLYAFFIFCRQPVRIVLISRHMVRMEKVRTEVKKNLTAEDRKWFMRSRWLTNYDSYNQRNEDVEECL